MFSYFLRLFGKQRPKVPAPVLAPLPPDDDMDWFFPPRDVHDHAAWDHYWHDQVTHGLAPPLFDLFCDDSRLIECLLSRGVKTLLCAGNGISQEPRALAAAGFDVTVMDLSPTAIYLAQQWQFSAKELDRFCPERLRTSGGATKFVVGDILNITVCPGPFDAIIERRTLQLFPPDERGLAFDKLAARLKPDGLFLSHCHDGGWRPPNPRVHQVEKCFRDRGWAIGHGEVSNHTGRVAWLVMSTG